MKILKNIIIIVVILLIIAYLSLRVFVSQKGKALVSRNLSRVLGTEVSLGSVNLGLPFSININDLEIKDLVVINRINADPSIIGLFLGKVVLNKITIVNPTVTIIRTGESDFNFSPVIEHIKRSQGEKIEFLVKEAFVRNGKISFKDEFIDTSFDISPIELSVVTSLIDFKTRIDLDAQALSSSGNNLADIRAAGWLNFIKKDMDAEFSVDNLELVYFTPYSKDFLRKVESGKLLFNAKMVSQNNDLVIDCHLETHNLKFVEQEPVAVDTQKKLSAAFDNLSTMVLGTLIGTSGGGIFDFFIHTKFDNPKLEGLQFKGTIFKESIKNIIENPEETIEKFKKAGEDFEKVGEELKEQFKDFEDIFKGFKKKGEEENPATGDSETSGQ